MSDRIVLNDGDAALVIRANGGREVYLPKAGPNDPISVVGWQVTVCSTVLHDLSLWEYAQKVTYESLGEGHEVELS